MKSSAASTTWAIAAALVVATWIAFLPVRDNGFIGFDDPRYLTRNDEVRAGLTLRGLAWAFSSNAYNWHPLTWISHMADVEAFGLDPAAHHRTNVVIHAANAVLVFVLLRVSTGALWPSALVAFVFALHPLRVESVAWASERKDVLGAMFWLLTMIVYVAYARRPSAARYGLVLLAFAAGLMSKPMLVTLPFVLLLWDLWPLGHLRFGATGAPPRPPPRRSGKRDAGSRGGPTPRPATRSWRRLLIEKLPLLGLAAGASVMALRAHSDIVQSVEQYPVPVRIANAVVSCVRYLGKMVWPADLAVFYPYRERSLLSPEVLGSIALLGVLTAIALRQRRRGYPIVGWLWFLGTLVPVLGLVQAGIQSMADRYTYLPGLGVLIAVVWGGAEALERLGTMRAALARRALVAVGVVSLAVLGWLTWRQVRIWRNDETLFAHAAAVTEGSYWARYNLGLTLLDAGRAREAVPQFEQAVEIEPTAEALVNLGRSLESTGRVEDAIAAFRRAHDVSPDDLPAARHLSRALVSNGGSSDAEALAERAAERWPEDAQLRYTVGIARLLLDRPQQALDPLRRAVALDPSYAAAHNALGIALARTGDRTGAIEHFGRAVELEPGYDEARANLMQLGGAVSPSSGDADPGL